MSLLPPQMEVFKRSVYQSICPLRWSTFPPRHSLQCTLHPPLHQACPLCRVQPPWSITAPLTFRVCNSVSLCEVSACFCWRLVISSFNSLLQFLVNLCPNSFLELFYITTHNSRSGSQCLCVDHCPCSVLLLFFNSVLLLFFFPDFSDSHFSLIGELH